MPSATCYFVLKGIHRRLKIFLHINTLKADRNTRITFCEGACFRVIGKKHIFATG